MIKNISILLAAIILLSTGSCKKEEPTDNTNITPPVIANAKVKLIVHQFVSTSRTDTFTYDGDGRIISRNVSDGTRDSYTYPAGQVVQEYYNSSGVLQTTRTYFLNANNRADSMVVQGSNTNRASYKYDAAGYLISSKNYNSSNTLNFIYSSIWENGNLKEQYTTTPTNEIYSHTVNNYDVDHKNSAGGKNTGLEFLGKSSANPQTEQYYQSMPSTLYIYRYEYTFDSEGSIATFTSYNGQGEFSTSMTYTYY